MSTFFPIPPNFPMVFDNSLIRALNQGAAISNALTHSLVELKPLYANLETVKLFTAYSQTAQFQQAVKLTQHSAYLMNFRNEQVTEIIQRLNHNPMIESWQKTEAALSSLIGNGEINQFFPRAMELTKEIDADSFPEMQMPAIPPKQAKSIRSLLPPLNLSERAFQIFLVVLGCILQLLCDKAQSNNADILENQRTQIAIQQEILETQRTQIDLQRQILEELKKSSSACSSNISISHTGNR